MANINFDQRITQLRAIAKNIEMKSFPTKKLLPLIPLAIGLTGCDAHDEGTCLIGGIVLFCLGAMMLAPGGRK